MHTICTDYEQFIVNFNISFQFFFFFFFTKSVLAILSVPNRKNKWSGEPLFLSGFVDAFCRFITIYAGLAGCFSIHKSSSLLMHLFKV